MVPLNRWTGVPGTAGGGVQKTVSWAGVLYSVLNRWCADLRPWCSLQIHSDQVANPSCSQMSGHSVSVTESPYHMCESSCASVASSGLRSNTGLVCVSSEYPTFFASSTTAPTASNGYGP